MKKTMTTWLCLACLALAVAASNSGCDSDDNDSGSGTTSSSAPAILPSYEQELTGSNPVRVRNPNDFSVAVGLRSGNRGKDFTVAANGTQTVSVPNGRYDIYFIYSDNRNALFQGDSFTLNNNGVEIQIVQVVDGNYNIRQVR